ncbi:hypothetical protein Pmar_PMAR022488 [Perkinsus marinus ATCC 50983]|uniref:Uncharacterized protein n=1 Tax=Perkinsus marinus (strain ATCC 50983 / TXsc) TaxID=423536 RepID=C5KNE0_PERM5|nr:hypothetical protein Pmar_PMAR022488 [Perkinsus marinus ATCC 50983]EER13955.1 hypothetical protein Pmar_PMAR022488 [Perkinsus marinus ATCC 50983]|eukprot:XP_002782160.1 hypothetical protein Pmar_PMAR022488 [Perkinsus marinus ATCC 50983]
MGIWYNIRGLGGVEEGLQDDDEVESAAAAAAGYSNNDNNTNAMSIEYGNII